MVIMRALACSLAIPEEESDLCLAYCMTLVPIGSTGASLMQEPACRVHAWEIRSVSLEDTGEGCV